MRIDRPTEAGADRLANALAARIEFGGPAIVIDLGTSTNFDLVDADGAYIGGAIAPGLGLSLEALVGRASKLPRIELRRPPSAIGANTVHAMQSGTVLGYIGLVSGLLTALRGELLGALAGGQPGHGHRDRRLHPPAVASRGARHRRGRARPHAARDPLRVAGAMRDRQRAATRTGGTA